METFDRRMMNPQIDLTKKKTKILLLTWQT